MSNIDILEFFNRIINSDEISEEEIKTNIKKFYTYLELTKMCSDEELEKLSKIVICINEILVLKKTLGHVDVNTLLDNNKQYKLTRKNTTNRHYNHIEEDYSSSCGGSSRTRYTSRC